MLICKTFLSHPNGPFLGLLGRNSSEHYDGSLVCLNDVKRCTCVLSCVRLPVEAQRTISSRDVRFLSSWNLWRHFRTQPHFTLFLFICFFYDLTLVLVVWGHRGQSETVWKAGNGFESYSFWFQVFHPKIFYSIWHLKHLNQVTGWN